MQVVTNALRGRGVEKVNGGGPVVARHGENGEDEDGERFNGGYIQILSKDEFFICVTGHGFGSVTMSVEELRTIIGFLRANGIEVDPTREEQLQLAVSLVQSFAPPMPTEPHITFTWKHRYRADQLRSRLAEFPNGCSAAALWEEMRWYFSSEEDFAGALRYMAHAGLARRDGELYIPITDSKDERKAAE